MPGPLKRYEHDPEGKGRGGGLYWHRGRGEYSKYTMIVDRKVQAKNLPQKEHGYHHTGDVFARIWGAEKIARTRKLFGLQKATEELARIGKVSVPSIGLGLKGRGGRRTLAYYRPHTKEIRISFPRLTHAQFDPMGALFHEFGHHLTLEKGLVSQVQSPLELYRAEKLAESYEKLLPRMRRVWI